jgi:hypothetical protein
MVKISCEYVGDWENSYPLYRADDLVSGFTAYGTTHHQAISNVLGLVKNWLDEMNNKNK